MIDQSLVLVSVCMITYKHGKFLEKAIEGVLIQKTNFKVELIISDDASPDHTEEVVQKYLNKSGGLIQIVYYKHSINKGPIPNFIWSYYKCKGKYIAICEGDDFWTDPYKLQRQVDFLEINSDYVLSFHDRAIINEYGEILRSKSLPNSIKRDLNFEDLAQGVYTVPTQTVLFRNCILEFPKDFEVILNGDTFLFLLLSKNGKFYFDEKINGAAYRIHKGGIWSSIKYEKSLFEAVKTYTVMYNYFDQNCSLGKSLLNRRMGLISHYWKNRQLIDFSRELFFSINIIIVNPNLLSFFVSKVFNFLLK